MLSPRQSAAVICLALLVGATLVWASITGSISGVVTDPTGAVLSGAAVVATNTQTGVATTLTTDSKGFYNFSALPVGTYDMTVTQSGFKTYSAIGLVVNANSAIRSDVVLQVGTASEKVTVESNPVRVETESTQMGEVISSSKITAVPLNGRAFTDLLALQPGVSPYTAKDTTTPGLDDRSVDGGRRTE